MSKNDLKWIILVLIIPCIYNKQFFLPTNQEDAPSDKNYSRELIDTGEIIE